MLKKKVPMLAGVLAVGLVTSLFAPNGRQKQQRNIQKALRLWPILISKDSPH